MPSEEATANAAEIEKAKSRRKVIKGQLTRLKNFVEGRSDSLSLVEVETRLANLRVCAAKFESVQGDLEEIDPSEADKEDRGLFEETSTALEERLLALRGTHSANEALNATMHSQSIVVDFQHELPPAKIPTFSGNYLDWPSFINQFDSLVHSNSKLSGTRKMQLLIDALDEAVKPTINRFQVSEANYSMAREALEARFNRKRLIFEAFIKRLLNLQSASDSKSLRSLSDGVNSHLNALNLIANATQIADGILIMMVLRKVDAKSLGKWEEASSKTDELPTWKEFSTFLERRCITLESMEFASFEEVLNEPKIVPKRGNFSTSKSSACGFCAGSCKTVKSCDRFHALNARDRTTHARKLNLCMRCLVHPYSEEHRIQCHESCKHCDRYHNSLLHWGKMNERQMSMNENKSADATVALASNHLTFNTKMSSQEFVSFNKVYTFLGTAYVKVRNSLGEFVLLRAMFDGGAQMNFITAKAAKLVGLDQKKTAVEMAGVHGDVKVLNTAVELEIFSRDLKFQNKFWAVVNPHFHARQPTQFVNTDGWNHLSNVELADPKFNIPHEVDLILNSHITYGWQLQDKIHIDGFPILQKTLLGWVVVGNWEASCTLDKSNYSFSVRPGIDNVMHVLQRFWELEEVPKGPKLQSEEEKKTVEHFYDTMTRSSTGRVIVRQCFKENPENLGASYGTAMRRLVSLERQLERNPELAPQVHEFIEEYIRLGHCEVVERLWGLACFIPYFYVINSLSTTTKIRVVFDASCATASGDSLNDMLCKGPVIQDSLFVHLIRFQLWPVALGGDVCKMYRMFEMHEDDQRWQCILYRRKPSDKVQILKLKTVTYGLKPSSYQATQAMQYLADTYAEVFPVGARAIKNNFYVDDGILGAATAEDALRLMDEVKSVLVKGCLEIRKWCSNNQAVMDKVPEKEKGEMLKFEDREMVKTLGHWWMASEDSIVYHYDLFEGPITARAVISETAKIYDPLGKIQPVVVMMKIFMQGVTASMKDLDAPLAEKESKAWQRIRECLLELNKIKVPRYALVFTEIKNLQIHGFSDASCKAYAAALFVRTTSQSGRVAVRLLCSKSKVAPLKRVTLPRLELMGAHLLAKLWSSLAELLHEHLKIEKTIFWVDATIVHSWVLSSPHKFDPFIACRVTEIQQWATNVEWQHVRTHENPADAASRGQTPKELESNTLWFTGPTFLYQEENEWPKRVPKIQIAPEQASSKIIFVAQKSSDLITERKLMGWRALQRVFGYVSKFLRLVKCQAVSRMFRGSAGTILGGLGVADVEVGTKIAVRFVQNSRLKHFLDAMKSGQPEKCGPYLARLRPFLGEDGILRVGGRLSKAEIPYDAKFQMILPYDHWLTRSLFIHTHVHEMHSGSQALLAAVRQRFWPINGKVLANKTIHFCLRCRWVKPIAYEQIMGNLPSARLATVERPFVFVGVDFAGPFIIKQKGRGKMRLKVYMCIFVCLVTKAVHIEIVEDLTTDAFLNTLQRFVSRRGAPQQVWSDNGKNFIGARNKLRELGELLANAKHQERMREWCCLEIGAEWHTIPIYSPNIGGMWEAGVKIAKHHLVRVLGEAILEYHELETVFIMIEAVMNSRPLIPVSNDPRDDLPITPAHFILGEPLRQLPEPDLQNQEVHYLKKWQRVVALKQQLFKRYRNEYWSHLQTRYKWSEEKPNAMVGQKVMIVDRNQPSLRWPWGIIVAVKAGDDGKVRVASVRSGGKTTDRNVRDICPLPFEETEKD